MRMLHTAVLVATMLLVVAGAAPTTGPSVTPAPHRSAGATRQVYSVPTPGSGILTVTGNVSVTNTPSVTAHQEGVWKVTVTDQPTISLPTPSFLQVGRTYAVTWPASTKPETYRIGAFGTDGWVRVESVGNGPARRVKWLNTSGTATFEEVKP